METKTLEVKTNEIVVQANGLVVTTNEQETFAVEFCKVIKGMQKQVGEAFDPIVEKAHQAHKEATTQRAKFLDPLKNAEKMIKDRIGTYRLELERKRQEEQRKAQEALNKQVEEERKNLIKQADEAAWNGDDAKAAELTGRAIRTEPGGVAVASKAVKQEGMAVPMIWKARVVNAELVPREFCVVDEKLLNAHAKAHGASRPVAGVEFYEEPSVRIRI